MNQIFTLAITAWLFAGCNYQKTTPESISNNDQPQTATRNMQNPTVQNISEAKVSEFIDGKSSAYELIDVRTPSEVASGYLKSTQLFIDINSNDFKQKMNGLDKEKTYIVYCRSGGRSSSAANYMIQNGFKHVYNLSNGLMNWSNASYIVR
jgi:rhodanese-related sulfurtransferase